MDITELDLLFRALASPSRLDLLQILLQAPPNPPPHLPPQPLPDIPGTTPGELASRLALSPSTVSHHLRILLRMRLVRYWKRGTHKFYTPSHPPTGSVRERLLTRLAEDLPPTPDTPARKPHRGHGRGSRPARHRDIAKSPQAKVWSALTAFSNFRRMLMLRALRRRGGASLADLMHATGLDRKTVKYHLAKLFKRGLLVEGPSGASLCERPPTRLHGLGLALVSSLTGT